MSPEDGGQPGTGAACEFAVVKPTARDLDGEDPTAYVLSANIHRRHMTKGQRAMAVAMIYPGGSGKGANPKNLGFSGEYLRNARTVLEHAPDLAGNVLSGAASLDAAYKDALATKNAAATEDEQLADLRAR